MPAELRERRVFVARGSVQGVGFRPQVFALARSLALGGFVRNERSGVRIEVEGPPPALDAFERSLSKGAKPPALIRALERGAAPARGERGFRIVPSEEGAAGGLDLAPDLGLCADCAAEMSTPDNRRAGYALIACIRCGPRWSMARALPFDRERTSMADFPLCAACQVEYRDPADRRFHAQATACADCGPQLRLIQGRGAPIPAVIAALKTGGIAAVKGLGGYQLLCDASDPAAVSELRRRKRRPDRPLALLVADLAAAEELVILDAAARSLLSGPERPIVLAPARDAAALRGVAPGLDELGLMLPSTGLQALIASALGRPLVATSANRSGAPIIADDDDAELGALADVVLAHDRDIVGFCDDSLARAQETPALLRRARGYAPSSLPLPLSCARPILALGGQLKACFAFARGGEAFLSSHIGDLHSLEAQSAFAASIARLESLLGIEPALLVHDLHPDYASTRYARERGLPALAVQHHHAHMASVLAENRLEGPVIGLCLDGAGLGEDGNIWGGEALIGDFSLAERVGHLRPLALVGGDRAARQPWRSALALLALAEAEDSSAGAELRSAVGSRRFDNALRLLRGGRQALCSSAGRLWDAAAALIIGRLELSYEGQAAMELEALARRSTDDGAYPFLLGEGRPRVIDPAPMLRCLLKDRAAGLAPEVLGRRFHRGVAAVFAALCEELRSERGLARVVLSGGVFQNRLFARDLRRRLEIRGFQVFEHARVPTNDGGLCLGQLAIAAARCEGGA